jgi:hypothetical protein
MPAKATIGEAAANDNECTEQSAWRSSAPCSSLVRQTVEAHMTELMAFVDRSSGIARYEGFERELIARHFRLGRLLIALYLCLWQERTAVETTARRGRAEYRRQPPKARNLGTFFGKVRYWRMYLHQVNGRGGGYYPVDEKLGLTADGFSFGVLGRAVELATKMSYAAAAAVMKSFIGWAPATKTIEEATLGLGRHTAAWFEHAPAPDEDGDVLIIQVDSKGTPTATDKELQRRRGKRRPNPFPGSKRHRGRHNRKQRGPKKRRKKGDKSKNAKMATLVVMYTLRRTKDKDGKPVLLGPINQRVYASYASKRHAFAIARREADKRGFKNGTRKIVQVLTDGDPELQRLAEEHFPKATHTNDVMHCIEYIWKAGACIYKEGTVRLRRWVEERKKELYGDRVDEMLDEMNEAAARIANAKRRARYEKCLDYLIPRARRMNYGELRAADMEIATSAAEGAVRYVISQRFDEGGMRWIRERAEALLQLRCIQINGDWERFIEFAHQRTRSEGYHRPTLLQAQPEPLPTFGIAA